MEESESSRNSSICSDDSDEPTLLCSSTEVSEELYLSPPTEVSPYRFEPIYSFGEPGSTTNSSLLSETEYSGAICVGNTDW